MNQYDVVVIGAGPGGYVGAIRATQLGLKVAIVDKQWLGGVCLNVGCIPSKALLRNAEVAHLLREQGKEFGFSFENLQLDFPAAVKRSRQVSDRLTKGVKFLMNKNGIDVFMGAAFISAHDTIQVTSPDGTKTDLNTKNILVATGATPFGIPGIDIDGEKVVTYLEAIQQSKLPRSVVIIGGGAIGLEFATVWNSYGADVTIVEMLPRIAPQEDEEISDELTKRFQKSGIKVLAAHKVQSINPTSAGVIVKVTGNEGETTLEAEQTLLAIGFKPNSKGFGLEEAGVQLNQRGFVEVNEHMATNIPGIWAVGDVTGKLLLAHTASAMGKVCAENIAGAETITIDYRMVPKAIYSRPQVASFGYTEAQAKELGFEIKVGRFPFQPNGKALGLGDYNGFVKIITDSKTGEILGAHMIGPDVSELLPELTLAEVNELTINEIARNIHAHPTLSEVVMEAAEAAEGRAIHM